MTCNRDPNERRAILAVARRLLAAVAVCLALGGGLRPAMALLFLSDEAGAACTTLCPTATDPNKLTVPDADLIKIQNPLSEPAGAARDALSAAKSGFEQAGRTVVTGAATDSLDDFKTMIMDAATAAGRAISVVLIGHGAPGLIDLGSDNLDSTTKEAFASMLRGKISSLTLFSCSTGAGASGRAFNEMLSSNLGRIPVMAFNSCIGIDNSDPNDIMFFASGGDSAKLTFIPAPATLALLGVGLAGLGVARRRQVG